MKIVVLDGIIENPGDLSWDAMGELGELVVYDTSEPEQVAERLKGADAAIINKIVMDGPVMDACPDLKYIGVMATGYNVVDVEEAGKRGIAVTNVPGYGTEIVSQYTIALLLEICHQIGHHSREVHNGRWSRCGEWCFWDTNMMGLDGKTLGVIGYGQIGRAVAGKAKAFGMTVLACSSSGKTGMDEDGTEFVTREELYRRSDVITLHCPMLPDTAGIINRDSIAQMKDGVILLNTSRGGLVVDADLAEALNSGKIRAAALDVISKEPIPDDNPLLQAKNCIITPHIAWAAVDARQRIMDMIVENLRDYQNGIETHRVDKR